MYYYTAFYLLVITTDQLGPHTLLYKLNEDKTLTWLQSKLQRVLSALMVLHSTAIKNGTKGSQAGMVLGFNAPHINDTVVVQPLTTTAVAAAAADNSTDVSSKQHSSNEHIEKALELVCEYLTPEWSQKLANAHKLESTSLFEARGTKRKAVVPVWESTKQEDRDLSLSIGGVNKSNGSSDTKRKATVNRTTSKLAKVNTKGMKSIASMFGSKPKSK
jgi:hypothetical protein